MSFLLWGKIPSQKSDRNQRPIQPTRLTRAGGVGVTPEDARTIVIPGRYSTYVWFNDLCDRPGTDMALHGGDCLAVRANTRPFTAFRATGGRAPVPFYKLDVSTSEANPHGDGLISTAAQVTGVSIFRIEATRVKNAVAGRSALTGHQPLVCLMD